jgi:hypothetical protein
MYDLKVSQFTMNDLQGRPIYEYIELFTRYSYLKMNDLQVSRQWIICKVILFT